MDDIQLVLAKSASLLGIFGPHTVPIVLCVGLVAFYVITRYSIHRPNWLLRGLIGLPAATTAFVLAVTQHAPLELLQASAVLSAISLMIVFTQLSALLSHRRRARQPQAIPELH